MPQHVLRVARFAALPATAGILIGLLILHPRSIASWNQGHHLKFGQSLSAEAASGDAQSYRISPLKSSLIYELLISGKQPGDWPDSAILNVKLGLPGGQAIHKALNGGDPDMYFMFQPSAAGAGTLEILADGAQQPLRFEIHLQRLPIGGKDFSCVGRKPAQSWKVAREMQVGRTVFAADDEIEYLNNRQEGKSGLDWYWFEYQGPKPKLVMFDVDVLDRDVPVNIRIYKQMACPHGPAIGEYSEGKDPQEILHDMQKEIESKFVTRVIQPGKYYIAVIANHPAYQLRTTLRDVPPYKDPRAAVQTAMDYIIAEADSWFAHTPRGGSRQTRVENVTDETERCVACHAGHFTMRSSLEAVKNGYPVEMRPEFKFMMDKLYNSMVPFYGLPDVNWLRFDLAPGDGSGATRVFEQYFYFAVKQPGYLRALLQHVSDPDLLVRIQSTKAVWRWYYRTQNPALRVSILDTLLGQTANERSPDEQLNLSQALYNVMDDNIGLMYTYWLPTMGEESDREAAHEGHFRHEILLASKTSAGLEHGDELEKRAILRAMGDYFLRARIGNDLDFVTFYTLTRRTC